MELKELLRPLSVAEAVEMLTKHPEAKILAGGTDLLLELKKNNLDIETLISLRGINELKKIIDEEEKIIVGSMVTFSDLRKIGIIKEFFPSMVQCADKMGSPQIRNMATIAGNIANGASAADIVPCLIALKAKLKIVAYNSERIVSLEDYFMNYSENRLTNNELIKEIVIAKNGGKCGFYKLGKRNSLAISRINACIWIELKENKIIDAELALGAVGRYPFKVKDFKKMAVGKDTEFLFSSEACSILEEAVYNSIKGRKTMPFKKEAVKGVYKEALKNALNWKNNKLEGVLNYE